MASQPCRAWLETRDAATFLGAIPLPEVICQAFRCGNGSYWISEGFLCRGEWHEWAQKPDEVDDGYAMRIRMTFTFSVEGVPAHLREKDFHTDGRSAAKQGAFSIVLPASSGCSQHRGMCPANKHLSCMVACFPPSRGCACTLEAEGTPHRRAQRCQAGCVLHPFASFIGLLPAQGHICPANKRIEQHGCIIFPLMRMQPHT
jgi:hypothetical protein